MTNLLNVIEFTLSYNSWGKLNDEQKELIKLQAKEIAEAYKYQTQTKTEKDVESWLDEWLALFPIDITTGGRPVQSSPEQCFDKMVKFVKRTKYNKDLIFKATELYLEERSLHNFAYTKAAQYFIDKRGEGSLLEDWCRKVQTGEAEEIIQEANEFNEFI